MTSRTHRHFWTHFDRLPAEVQAARAGKVPALAKRSLFPPLQFKPLLGNVWSARIGPSYRALARRADDLVVWFWIGTHEEYNNLIQRLR